MHSDGTRASDAEREQIVALLRAAAAEGRLDIDELDERTAAAYAAKTRGELAALLDDLPRLAPPPTAGPPVAPVPAGFVERWHAPVHRERAIAEALQYVAPPLHAQGYRLVHRGPDQLVFERKHRPAWTFVLAVLVFPVGLLALLHEERELITVNFLARGSVTDVTAHGHDLVTIRRAFALLSP